MGGIQQPGVIAAAFNAIARMHPGAQRSRVKSPKQSNPEGVSCRDTASQQIRDTQEVGGTGAGT